MLKRLLLAVALCVGLFASGCGGSDAPAPGAPTSNNAEIISEQEAVDKAKAAAIEQGFSPEGLLINPAELFGEWQVSFTEPDTDSLGGGFLVVLNSATGEFLDLIEYQ